MTITPTRFTVELPDGPLALPGAAPEVWMAGAREYPAASRVDVLDEGERRRAATFVRDADRELYTVAHVALRMLLGRYLAADPAELALTRLACPGCGEPHGRPAVEGVPLHFSLSHSDGTAVLAFASLPVGADVERLPEERVVGDVAPHLHPREAAELSALDDSARPGGFARVWARKEAYVKGLGIGLARGLDRDYVGSGPVPHSPSGWRITDVAVPDTHRAAVATAVAGGW
ncbi:4'-phosphopantetheinyl transferase family protein [Streptomyces sp. NPDC060194]|uniref:4'-phosphopantetheinyl transferase family protein n=1 Tax=Streptomyces sp. NPDC060194 TaxID=3347069 RepID=UPI0036678784